MELQIGCFEYSMELENGKVSGDTLLYLSAKPSKTRNTASARITPTWGKARAEGTRVTSKIMEVRFKPEVSQCWKTSNPSVRRVVNTLPVHRRKRGFSFSRIENTSTLTGRCWTTTAQEARFGSLIIYNYRSLTRRDRITCKPEATTRAVMSASRALVRRTITARLRDFIKFA